MNAPAPRLCFGGYQLDPSTGELTREGTPVPLEHQPALVLARLVRSPGSLVTREELASLLWGGGTFVKFDDGLNYCLRRIRVALQDDPRAPRFIETIPRRGYRFIAPVTAAVPDASRRRRMTALIVSALLLITVVVESQPNRHHEVAVAIARTVHDLLF